MKYAKLMNWIVVIGLGLLSAGCGGLEQEVCLDEDDFEIMMADRIRAEDGNQALRAQPDRTGFTYKWFADQGTFTQDNGLATFYVPPDDVAEDTIKLRVEHSECQNVELEKVVAIELIEQTPVVVDADSEEDPTENEIAAVTAVSTPTPSMTPTVQPSPTNTPTATPDLTATAEVAATETAVAAETATAEAIQARIAATNAAAVATANAAPPVTNLSYSVQSNKTLVLSWSWTGTLDEHMYFAVRIEDVTRADRYVASRIWTKDTNFTIMGGTEAYPENEKLTWRVAVIRDTPPINGTGNGDPSWEEIVVSSDSEFRVPPGEDE